MTPKLPFKVKSPLMLSDKVHSFDSLCYEAQESVLWLCDYCKANGLPVPTFTRFGSTRDDNKKLYFKEELKKARGVLKNGKSVIEVAEIAAFNRFSYHNVFLPDLRARAWDLRIQQRASDQALVRLYTDDHLFSIIKDMKAEFPTCGATFEPHGTGPHLHTQFKLDPKPTDWL